MHVILSGAPLREENGAESKDPVSLKQNGILRLHSAHFTTSAPLRMTLPPYGCVTRQIA
jgi:hypothetical protein